VIKTMISWRPFENIMPLIVGTALATWLMLQYVVIQGHPIDENAKRDKRDASKYDAVIVLGGGLDATGQPHPWVKARLDLGATMNTDMFVLLSRGTTHKPPPLDQDGFPIDEATASAKYLVDKYAIPMHSIVTDTWSLDTIGNAYFAAAMVCEPLNLKRLKIISSHSHIHRTKAIFDWIFPLWGSDFVLEYQSSADVGMDPDMLLARQAKEEQAVKHLNAKSLILNTKHLVADFILKHHGAYVATGRKPSGQLTDEQKALRKTY